MGWWAFLAVDGNLWGAEPLAKVVVEIAYTGRAGQRFIFPAYGGAHRWYKSVPRDRLSHGLRHIADSNSAIGNGTDIGNVMSFTTGGGLYSDEPSTTDGFKTIDDALLIAYHYSGFSVWDIYWPDFDIDTIEMLIVGKVYLIYVDYNCTLQYGAQSYELNGPDWNFIYWLGG